MRRDMDFVREVLIDIANGVDNYKLHLGRYADADIEKVKSDEKLFYHLKIMNQKNLVNFKYFEDMTGECEVFDIELTWDGQDYLSTIENDTIWNKTKSATLEKGLDMAKIPFEVLKSIAILQTKTMLGLE